MSNVRRLALILFLAAVLVAVAWAFLFRRSTHDNPVLGVITIEYRWGRPSFTLVDANRDGIPDARERLRPSGEPSPHETPAELWESTRCDGVYDLHAVFDPSGSLTLIEFDADRDGRYDTRFEAEAASSFWREIIIDSQAIDQRSGRGCPWHALSSTLEVQLGE